VGAFHNIIEMPVNSSILFLPLLVLASLVSANVKDANSNGLAMKQRSDFTLDALTDFVHDVHIVDQPISA
jgi:hypothetical protein